jgi:hypothetical protein
MEAGMDMSGLDRDRESDGAAAKPKPARKRRGGGMRVLGVILILLLLTVALLPRILSSAGARAAVLARVNTRLAPGSLDVHDWTLRWLSPLRFEGISFQDPARGLEARLTSVTVSHGLLRLLPFGGLKVGEVTVERPEIRMNLPPPATTGQEKDPAAAKPKAGLPVSDLSLRLTVVQGSVEFVTASAGACKLEQLAAALDVTSLREPVMIKAEGRLPLEERAGRVTVEGGIQSPLCFLTGSEAPPEKLSCTVSELDLRVLQPLLQAFTGQPWIRSGMADGRVALTLQQNGGTAQVDAEMTVRRFSVSVPGRSDTPAGDLIFRADLTRQASGIDIRSFTLTSPWIGAAAQGQLAAGTAGAPPLGRVRAKADVNLAALVRDFGPLLKLSDNLKVERGRLTADIDVDATPEGRTAGLVVETSDLSVRLGSESVVIAPPPSLRARVRMAANQPPEVSELSVVLPFAQLNGKGRLDAATLSGRVDLTKFSRDFSKLLKDCPPMVGQIELRAETRREADFVHAHAVATATDLAAKLKVAKPAPHLAQVVIQKGALTFDGRVPMRNGQMAPEIEQAVWSLDADGCRLNGEWARLVPPGKDRKLVLQGFKTRVEVDLAAAASTAQPVLPLPDGAVLGGKWIANATAEASDQLVKARFTTAVSGLVLTTTAWNISDPDVRAEGALEWNGASQELKATGIKVSSLPLKAEVPTWLVRLPTSAQKTGAAMSGRASGTLDIGALTAWRRPPKDAKQALPVMRGRATFEAQAATGGEGSRVDLDAAVENLFVMAPGAKPYEEKRAELKAVAGLSADGQSLTLDSVRVKSALAEIVCAGKIGALQKEKQCDVSGTVTVDLAAVTTWLQAQGLTQVRLTGRQARPFELHGALGNGPQALLSFGRASGAVAISSVETLGLKAGPADFAFTLDKGVASLRYEPALEDGWLRLKPSVQVAVKPMVLDMPRETKVLENVPLTQGLVDELLARVNPLLRQCTALGGRVDFIVRDCRVPLGPEARQTAALNVQINLRDVKLMPNGALAELISLAGMEQKAISIRQYTIHAEVRDGRVRPQPITIPINDTPVVFSGSVGLDGTLVYAADVPLAEGLVGREAWKYLKGEHVRVPVAGTLGSIRLDSEAARAEIKRVVRKAIEKAAVDKLGGLFDQLREDVNKGGNPGGGSSGERRQGGSLR